MTNQDPRKPYQPATDAHLIEELMLKQLQHLSEIHELANRADYWKKQAFLNIEEIRRRGQVRAGHDPNYRAVRQLITRLGADSKSLTLEKARDLAIALPETSLQGIMSIMNEFGLTWTAEEGAEALEFDRENHRHKPLEYYRVAPTTKPDPMKDVEPKNYVLNEQHTTHIPKTQARKEREERKAKGELYERVSRFLSEKEKKLLSKALLGVDLVEKQPDKMEIDMADAESELVKGLFDAGAELARQEDAKMASEIRVASRGVKRTTKHDQKDIEQVGKLAKHISKNAVTGSPKKSKSKKPLF